MSFSLRAARPSDAEYIEAIENAADALLRDVLGAADWPPAETGSARLSAPGFTLVAVEGDDHSPVGFVHVLDADGHAHLEQLSVLPSQGRRGIGRALVEAGMEEARARGYSRITLRTYAEVPWNAPFYSSCGFSESIPEGAFLRSLLDVEDGLGLDRWGRRVQMTALL